MTRQKLASRRAADTVDFDHDGMTFTATYSRGPRGELVELFLDVGKPGAPMHTLAKDLATLTSIALQYGVPRDEIMAALSQETDGTMRGPLGRALQIIEETT